MRTALSWPIWSSVPAEALSIKAVSSAATSAVPSPLPSDKAMISLLLPRRPASDTKRPGARPGRGSFRAKPNFGLVAAGAEQLHQHHEQVDEVEIEAQRPHDCVLAAGLIIVGFVIHLLDLLRVPRRQTGEND